MLLSGTITLAYKFPYVDRITKVIIAFDYVERKSLEIT